tara:strand:- start:10 stop:498 length:489 start_codon:yes stop_codon:yes gene_type:complete
MKQTAKGGYKMETDAYQDYLERSRKAQGERLLGSTVHEPELFEAAEGFKATTVSEMKVGTWDYAMEIPVVEEIDNGMTDDGWKYAPTLEVVGNEVEQIFVHSISIEKTNTFGPSGAFPEKVTYVITFETSGYFTGSRDRTLKTIYRDGNSPVFIQDLEYDPT